MSYFTYVLQSQKTGRYYVGSATNIPARLKRHNSGYVRSTKAGLPYILVYQEEHPTKQDAYRREREIKRYKGGNAFKKLVQSSHSGIV
ncbi:MAG: GIY-YIG nuclease family protein [Patescibacteria group bacterium]